MINYQELGFEYTETDYLIRCSYHDGKWGRLRATRNKYIQLHACSTALQYGQEAFEGLKAIRGIDGKIRIFRLEANAHRMQKSCEALYMAQVPDELFRRAILLSLKKNINFLPPYGTGASLYFRPLLIGTSPRLGVGPGKDYEFIIIASPIGEYFRGHFHTTTFLVTHTVDRAAPLGTGPYKVGGNYAASFRATEPAHAQGYGTLFLDATHHQYIDECGAANFFAIKGNTYVTPKSDSILPSITNDSLMTLARQMGMNVEQRPVPLTELHDFDECAACGTAAIVSPINKIIDPQNNTTYHFTQQPGPVCTKLYQALLNIQYGINPDTHNWTTLVNM